jgi:peptidoglycan/LPS O-acetylase OafA/YrhL
MRLIAQTENKNVSAYRPDIDGLRAIAVLLVITFHAYPEKVTGGFIGVDIFFVISGYLISLGLFHHVQSETFSILGFYERRVRRIFPALLTVIIVSFIVGWFILLPDEYKQLGKNIAGGAAFISNLLYWNESGYFDSLSINKPLLHLWSLGVEEQFYLFWPVLIYFLAKQKSNFLKVTICLTVVSFIANLIFSNIDSVAAFYSPLTRFWELQCGAILAWLTIQNKSPWLRKKNNFLSLIGLCMIGISAYQINESMVFPSWLAIFPVLGSLLVIASNQDGVINKYVFSNRLMVWFGLISYPLYLWHWPLISFASIIEGRLPDVHIRSKALLIALILSWLTYKFIEKPLRFGKYPRKKVVGLCITMVFVGFIGTYTFMNNGLVFFKKAPTLQTFKGEIGHPLFDQYLATNFYKCTPEYLYQEAQNEKVRCYQSKPNGPIHLALIGDSHAEHLFIGLAESLSNKNIVFYVKPESPFVDKIHFKKIYDYVLNNNSIQQVIIALNWHGKIGREKSPEEFEQKLLATASTITNSGKTLFITNDVPVFSFDPKICVSIRWPKTEQICNEKLSFTYYTDILNRVAAATSNTYIINTLEDFCTDDECSMIKDNTILYRDFNHLTIEGSQYIAKSILHKSPLLKKEE